MATGVKRKRMPEAKFYAVHVGKQKGIFRDWDECSRQVNGHRGAVYKSFRTEEEAQQFVENGYRQSTNSQDPSKFYAVQSGRIPGVYTNWADASKQIFEFDRPRYKAFTTREEAETFVNTTPTEDNLSPTINEKPTAKRLKKTVVEDPNAVFAPGEKALPEDAEDGLDTSIFLDPRTGVIDYKTQDQLQATKAVANDVSQDGVLRIYTDGSSRGNGKVGAMAGVGVYFGPSDKRNIAEPLSGSRQTNQRAELTAILRALEVSPRDRPLAIYSDSQYAINCVTSWFQKWRANGWVNASKKPVENRDLIEKIIGYIEEREMTSNKYASIVEEDEEKGDNGTIYDKAKVESWKKGRARVEFIWVKGHANDPGNTAADRLAVLGATRGHEVIRES